MTKYSKEIENWISVENLMKSRELIHHFTGHSSTEIKIPDILMTKVSL